MRMTLPLLLCLAAAPCAAGNQDHPVFTAHHTIQFARGTDQQRQQLRVVPAVRDLVAEPFVIAHEDLNDDGTKEIILMAASPMNCAAMAGGGCLVVVLENRGGVAATLLTQGMEPSLALTNEKVGAYRALAVVDERGLILKGDMRGTPMFGKQLVYPMKPPPAAQAPAARPAAQSACTGHPNCAETPTFVATVPDWRMSNSRYGGRIATATVRFVNKVNRTLVVGYVQNSGVALDDQGNRYIIQGADAVRGIGLIDSSRLDTKFSLAPGERADTRFEFSFDATNKVLGTTYEIDLTVREINAIAGGQWQLGREYVLHFAGFSDAGVGPQTAVERPGSDAASASTPGIGPGPTPTAAKPPAPAVDPCLNRPRCYNAGPFMSEVTRLVTAQVSAHRIVRVALQLTNLTDQPVRLGYLANTGTLIDDVGNRYSAVAGLPPSVTGIGIITTANIDSQFVLAAGESRGVSVELSGSPNRLGTLYSFDMTLVQLQILPSKQVRLAKEFPIGFKQLSVGGAIPASGGSAAAACGAKPRCYATGPFTTEVTRVSAAVESAHRVVRVTLRLTNVSSQAIILAYMRDSGTLVDNFGNQYGTDNSTSAISGIGLMSGNSVDTRFVLAPGQSRNASFELSAHAAQPGRSYSYDLTLAQVEILPSQQVQTIGEFAVGFSGLSAGLLDGLKDIIRKEHP